MNMRNHSLNNQCEKYLVRTAFSPEFYLNHESKSLLPDKILWRRKEAFSDGVSKTSRSLYEIIQEYTDTKFFEQHHVKINEISNKEDYIRHICENENIKDHLLPSTTEQYYYRTIFDSYYPGLHKILPYFWMPRFIEAKDASARTLDIYSVPPPFNHSSPNST
jgi:asparagine synthase (glutamine-hydrolysing)